MALFQIKWPTNTIAIPIALGNHCGIIAGATRIDPVVVSGKNAKKESQQNDTPLDMQ
jgi:hypothetical protein